MLHLEQILFANLRGNFHTQPNCTWMEGILYCKFKGKLSIGLFDKNVRECGKFSIFSAYNIRMIICPRAYQMMKTPTLGKKLNPVLCLTV